MNLFNEWHAANTSKKIRSVFAANAKQGKYIASFASYGYIKSDDANHTPIIDEPAAEVVRKIFDLRTTGITPRQIARKLNAEKILIPSDYQAILYGRESQYVNSMHLWTGNMVNRILTNQIYIGSLAQQRYTTISFKNHKLIRKSEEDWTVVENNHEAIISKEVWDKCREVDRSAAHGRITKSGLILPLNGFMYCADCGAKVKQNGHSKNKRTGERNYFYTCGTYSRIGKEACSSHYISEMQIQKLIVSDIKAKAKFVIENEEKARQEFLAHKQAIVDKQLLSDTQELRKLEKRLAELKNLIHKVYEDKLLGVVPEEICMETMNTYIEEQNQITERINVIQESLEQSKEAISDVDTFVELLKKYADIEVLTREMCFELIEYIVVGARPENKNEPRIIEIYYKFLDEKLKDDRNLLLN